MSYSLAPRSSEWDGTEQTWSREVLGLTLHNNSRGHLMHLNLVFIPYSDAGSRLGFSIFPQL
jgi:hypothetical protein